MGTDDYSLEEVIRVIEDNYGYGRRTEENEVKRLIARIRELEIKLLNTTQDNNGSSCK